MTFLTIYGILRLSGGQKVLFSAPISLREHVFYEDPVASGGIVDQHMGHGADDLPVLQDRRPAHPLHDPARLLKQAGIRHHQLQPPAMTWCRTAGSW